jgi:hypothetical protein
VRWFGKNVGGFRLIADVCICYIVNIATWSLLIYINGPNFRRFNEITPAGALLRGKNGLNPVSALPISSMTGAITMTNFEKRWAWFFTLLGWQWKYFPVRHGFAKVRPVFRVSIPYGHNECSGSHVLDVFLRRGVLNPDAFGVSVNDLAACRRVRNDPWSEPHPALFGDNPSASTWVMAHGAGGGTECLETWAPDWKKVWASARAHVRSVMPLPSGGLR